MAAASSHHLPVLDFHGAELRRDPFGTLRALQDESWCAEAERGFAVLRYAEVKALLRDRRLGGPGLDILHAQGITGGPRYEAMAAGLFATDGEHHKHKRHLLSTHFTPARVERLRPFMRELAHALVDRFAARGRCDFVTDFSSPYPLQVIAEMIGAPRADTAEIEAWTSTIGLSFGIDVKEHWDAVDRAQLRIDRYAEGLMEARPGSLPAELVGALVEAAHAGLITRQELRTFVGGLLFAGHDTTRGQLGLALIALMEHPEQWQRLVEEPRLLARATDELLRFSPVSLSVVSVATEPVELNGLTIPQGAWVHLCLGAANRDPRVFADPDRLDVTAERTLPLTFGGGIHRCLGEPLAKAEIQEALGVLVRRIGVPRLDGPVVMRRPTLTIAGPTSLPIAFTPIADTTLATQEPS